MSKLRKNNVEKYLRYFAESVIKKGRQILKAKGKEGKLSNSFKYRLESTNEGYNLVFKAADYATFVDKGVSGTKTTRTYHNVFGKRQRSPFSYKPYPTGLGANIGALEKWISRKGIKGRDKKTGKFIKTKSLAYLFSKSIQRKGLAATSFFSKPMSVELAKFDTEILKNFKADVITHFETIEL